MAEAGVDGLALLQGQLEAGEPVAALDPEQVRARRFALQETLQHGLDLVLSPGARPNELLATREAAAQHPAALIGHPYHIGARVGAFANAGEVLVSRTVADLVVGSGLRFTDRGEHELKGVPGHWRLLAVGDSSERSVESAGTGFMERDMRLSDRVVVRLARRAPRAMRAASDLGRRSVRRRG